MIIDDIADQALLSSFAEGKADAYAKLNEEHFRIDKPDSAITISQF